MKHGWFAIPGVQTGDRTLEEQMAGVWEAVAECKGKTVLDLGTSEGLIACEFAKAGASRVVGIDHSPEKIETAKRMCDGVAFICANLAKYIAETTIEQFDIVLALGIVTKMGDPAVPLKFAARSARDLLLMRTSAGPWDGIFKAKHGGTWCNGRDILHAEGFEVEKKIIGTHGEAVDYWRRK